jgi:sugar phosphate isomerase/epimerase
MYSKKILRRKFIRQSIIGGGLFSIPWSIIKPPVERFGKPVLKLSLNTYSFNKLLNDGTITLFDLIPFCVENGFDAIDPTGYYFPGYPAIPPRDFISQFRREVFLHGLEISGTGVRNDFTQTDPAKRNQDLRHIEEWIQVASELGAPLLRVFARKELPETVSRRDALSWVTEGLKQSAEIGSKYGVMIALQNHNEFLKTSEEVEEVLDAVDSPWLGLHLDIGSLQQSDPYQEVKKLVPYAITWQIKELVYSEGNPIPTDYQKIINIATEAGYRGYFPLETLGEGDPYQKVKKMIKTVKPLIPAE